MKDLKIRVDNEAESKEAQELFFELNYNWFKKGYMEVKTPETIMSFENGALSTGIRGSINHKEITLPELRDLVVLNRNDKNDANVIDPEYDASLYLDSKGDLFVFHLPTQKWKESNLNGEEDVMARLKPIEKPMKECLRKNINGTYSYIGTVRPEHVSDFMIEIPEGSNIAVIEDSKVKFYSKYTSADLDHLGKDLIWMRHTLPEELPFIDDEPKYTDAEVKYMDENGQGRLQSINDQYAEIEKVRQSAWQKQEGGSHYKTLKIQPMQYALENKLDYAQANVVKYVTRHKEKNGKEDLLKAIHNIELMIEFYYGDEE